MNKRFDLTGKTAIVTGAGRGIGRALAIGLAEAGAQVAAVSRTADELDQTVSEITSAGGSAHAIIADVTESGAARRIVGETIDQLGGLHILVNNAGRNIRSKALDVTEEEWDSITDLDLRAAFFMAQAAGAVMCDQKYGRIINIASVGGLVALRTGVAYGASKAGLIHMSRVLSLEWSKWNVTVNTIAPWYFRTPMTEKLLADQQYVDEILAQTPMGRVGELEELVGPAIFFASDAAAYVTGQVLAVDGGMSTFGF